VYTIKLIGTLNDNPSTSSFITWVLTIDSAKVNLLNATALPINPLKDPIPSPIDPPEDPIPPSVDPTPDPIIPPVVDPITLTSDQSTTIENDTAINVKPRFLLPIVKKRI
jgi:hypothetical protein